jgi:hypothetical protein
MPFIGNKPTAIPLSGDDIQDGTIGLDDLSATGTKDSTTFLRGDNTFASAGGTNTPNFHAFLGSSQSIANTTITTVVFDTETYDSASAYDTATGIFTVPSEQAGKYFIAASIRQSSATNYTVQCRITVNSKSITSTNSNFNSNTVNSSTVYNLSVGDTVKVQTYQDSGSTKDALGSATEDHTWFTMFKLIE